MGEWPAPRGIAEVGVAVRTTDAVVNNSPTCA
jgi:hypothetical protein